ncbi:MAG TPA: hypothetical protein VN611_05235 [Patescibacteria group bacterium]|nr:hypothetical protein [Patescibacteria group bacterium]
MKKLFCIPLLYIFLLTLYPATAFGNPDDPAIPAIVQPVAQPAVQLTPHPVVQPTVLTVPLPAEQIMEIQEFLPVFIKAEKLTCSIIYGQQPKMVIIGDAAAVHRLAALITDLAKHPVTRDLIYITASMEDVTVSGGSATGMNIQDIPVTANWTRTNANTTFTPATSWSLQAGQSQNVFSSLMLRTSRDDSRLLIAGQIATTNGMPGSLTHVEEVPYAVVNANGSSQIQYCRAETVIQIKPTLLEYNTAEPAKSLIKLDIHLQISVIGDQSNLYSTVNPIITTRSLTVTRILQADNTANAVAAIVHDENLSTEQGIPLLNKLPLLKYLFSQKTTVKERSLSLLKLAVRFIPPENLTDDNVKSLLSKPKGEKD